MANWSGTYTIVAGAIGPVTSATSTTLTNTGATWPTGAQSVANFTVRILAGTGSGQERIITSNTATVLTVPAWTTTPDATSIYEIVLVFKNGDHVTAALTLSTNITTELEDSAAIYIDGNYIITIQNNCVVEWAKTETTLVTFEPNNNTTQGTLGFWGRIQLATTLSATPLIEYIRIRDAAIGFLPLASTGLGDHSTVKKIWMEGCTTGSHYMSGAALSADVTISRMFSRWSSNALLTPSATASPGRACVYDRCWSEDCITAGPQWSVVPTQTCRDSVFKKAWSGKNINLNTGVTVAVQDCYITGSGTDNEIISGGSTGVDAGTHILRRSVICGARIGYGGAVVGTGTLVSAFNDVCARKGGVGTRAIDIGLATAYASSTSDNEYFSGTNNASVNNVDTTTGTTSSATPNQYNNLTTARTNAKSVRNKPLTVSGTVVGTPTGNSVVIEFDAENGAVSGQGSTTVNVDSSSGQPVLNVASTTGFTAGEEIEIGFGTARSEVVRLLSVGAGTLTATTNLVFAHTAAQADTTKKLLRNWGLPFIKYGTATGVYSMATDFPPVEEWGLVFCEIKTIYNGTTFAWKRSGHSVTLRDLDPGVTHYARPCYYTPLGELVEGAEVSFTTAASANYTDPGVANVRLATTYAFNSATPNRTGTARIPAVGNVKIGYAYDSSDALTGTYDGSERYTDLSGGVVLDLFTWKYNTTGADNRLGMLSSPSAAEITTAVWSESLTGYVTAGTAGYLVRRSYSIIKNLLGAFWSKIAP